MAMFNPTKEQQAALDAFGSNIVVSAGAGSGKTQVLSEKVKLILRDKNINPENLLVLTFTNAAAHEMKERIKKALAADEKVDRTIVDKINSAHIQTFDSFSLFVFKQFSYLENLDKNISLINDLDLKIITDKIIDDLLNEELFINKNNDLLELYLNYCFKNEDKIKNLIKMMYEFLNKLVDKDNILNNPESILISNEELVTSLRNKLFAKVKKDMNDLVYKYFITPKVNNFFENTSYISKIQECVLGKDIFDLEEYVNTVTKKFPKAHGLDESEKEIKNNFLEEKKSYLSTFKDCDLSFDYYKNNISDINKYILLLVKIVKKLDDRLLNYKRMINRYTFNDIALISLKILDNEKAQQYLKNKFKFILIDEYQDTSDIQEKFVSKISNNNVFMVGDVKQSIYRFRNANCNIFNDKFNLYKVESDKGKSIELNKNFRSRKEILNLINNIFSLLMGNNGIINYKKDHIIQFGQNLYDLNEIKDYKYGLNLKIYTKDLVNKLIDLDIIKNKDEAEAYFIAQDIIRKINSGFQVYDKDLKRLRKVKFSDFSILCRKKRSFSYIEKVFNRFGIPLNNTSKEFMSKFSAILVLKSIFNLIYYIDKNNIENIDNIIKLNFISIARSFLYSYSDEQIYNFIIKEDYKNTEIYKNIKDLRDFSKNNNLYNLYLEILSKFDFIENIYKIKNVLSNLDKLENFAVLSKEFDEAGKSLDDIINVFDYMDDDKGDIEIENISDDNAVNLMSVHASKGLEFPVVYLSDNNYRLKSKKGFEKSLIFSKDFNFMFKKNPLLKNNFFYPYENIFDFKEEIEENKRLYYVALTRAKEEVNIYLNITNKINNKANFASFIMESINTYEKFDLNKMFFDKENNFIYIEDSLDVEKIRNEDEKTLAVNNFSYDFKPYIKQKASKTIKSVLNEEEIENINFGSKLHEYLELIDFNNKDTFFIKDKDIKRKLDALLNIDAFKNIGKEDLVYKEYEFYDADNDIKGFIDLLVISKQDIKIFDYKLKNISDVDYTRQLKIYKTYIEKTLQKPCKIYLVSILEKKVEEVIL